MKIVLDMNLSPSWIDRLAQHGVEAIHWSPQILAATAEAAPSVAQLRMQDLLSERAPEAIVTAVSAHDKETEWGEGGTRPTVEPLHGSHAILSARVASAPRAS